MKKALGICISIIFGLAGSAHARVEAAGDWTVNLAIPQGNPVGITASQTFQDQSGLVAAVNVTLDISGGFNGGLYGYLSYQDASGKTATEILLNQVGTSPSNPIGSSGSGFDITLSDSGTVNGDIHNSVGIPTGTWLPDSPNSLNSTFGDMSPNGTWTLFLADLYEGGGTSTLDTWGLEVTEVPEPASAGLLAFGSLTVAVNYARRRKRERWQTTP